MFRKGLATALLLFVSGGVCSDDKNLGLGLYAVVQDIEQSKEFYGKLFESEPYVDNGDFVGYSLSGGLFALFAESAFEHTLTRGNGVVPYVRVADAASEFERIKALGVEMMHDELVVEGPISLFMFLDPSGNPIEFYSFIVP